ncbi:hypothetical protein KKC1_15630 [Calderihabitans maritimus]|uniref:Uncharacterized protein n=1 Tax=Calderihabitans maritimus TaxID=1246530 RepID=A0A1Z5HSA8_9FIRM|nr:hypothetical protein KKC1_15630 [Calderihabitans maritimus]
MEEENGFNRSMERNLKGGKSESMPGFKMTSERKV